MLSLEHSRHLHTFGTPMRLDESLEDAYTGLSMNQYDSFDAASSFAALPFYYENAALYTDVPQDVLNYNLHHPAISSGSLKPSPYSTADLSSSHLSTASGPSVPSAPSSTVGSPYSGHSHHHSTESWSHSSQGLAILGNEEFAPDFSTSCLDTDFAYAPHDKLSGNFVGESSHLSFSKPSAPFPVHLSPTALAAPPLARMTGRATASPEPVTIDSILERANGVPTTAGQSSAATTPLPRNDRERSSSCRSDRVFKSPSTPASAYPRTPQITAAAQAVNVAPVTASWTTPLSTPTSSHSQAPHHAQAHPFQNSFFAQSSGNFMPPIESSYPSLIQAPRNSYSDIPTQYAESIPYNTIPQTYNTMSPAGSPALSPPSFPTFPTQHFSPSASYGGCFQPQQGFVKRESSVASFHSGLSHHSPLSTSAEFEEEGSAKGRCPNPECGRIFKDLKAHMLTHQSERPEKCPISNCEYNQKGFARKYDKNRHTLTHYKGTMVCGFCPGSGSAAEKSFNRADVFKRHLTSVHGVEQTPPNSRKRSPTSSNRRLSSYCQDATGKCSTCSSTFTNAQDFYEHLDDCVLRVVQQEEPSEAVNQQRLAEVATDDAVRETLDRHMLIAPEEATVGEEDADDDEDDDDEDDDEEDVPYNSRSGKGTIRTAKAGPSSRPVLSGGITKNSRPAKIGLTYSKGGVPLVGKDRKKHRKHYPPSWGMSPEKMSMKKRVLCVYDGRRRLLKDDIMMNSEFEVRMKLADGKSYVTDLDVETIKRADAFHGATEEEKGPWLQHEQHGFDLEELMA